MSNPAQKLALKNYRERLGARGIARFEVQGLESDRGLIRLLAQRLAEAGPDAARLRTTLQQSVAGEPPATGGILAALRRSPLAGVELNTTRPVADGRMIDL